MTDTITIILILQVRKLTLKEVKELPKVTQRGQAESKHKPSSKAKTGVHHHVTSQVSAEGDTLFPKTLLMATTPGVVCGSVLPAPYMWSETLLGCSTSCTAEDSPSTETHLVQHVKRTKAEKPASCHLSGFYLVPLQASRASWV